MYICIYFCKSLNTSLSSEGIILSLLQEIAKIATDNNPSESLYRTSFLASRILSSDIVEFVQTLLQPKCLNFLLDTLENPTPLTRIGSGYLIPIVKNLLSYNSTLVLHAFETRHTVPKLLTHMSTYSIVDLFEPLLSVVAGTMQMDGLVHLLNASNVLTRLLITLRTTDDLYVCACL